MRNRFYVVALAWLMLFHTAGVVYLAAIARLTGWVALLIALANMATLLFATALGMAGAPRRRNLL